MKRLIETLVLTLLLSAAFALPVFADGGFYQEANGGSSAVEAVVITADTWHYYQKEEKLDEYGNPWSQGEGKWFYYKVQRPTSPCWASLTLECEDEKQSRYIKASIHTYKNNEEVPSFQTISGGKWRRYNTNEDIIVMVSYDTNGLLDGSKYKLRVDIVNDKYPETIDDPTVMMKRGDIISDTLQGSFETDHDCFHFKTDSNTLYKLVMNIDKIHTEEAGNNRAELMLTPYLNGEAVHFGPDGETKGTKIMSVWDGYSDGNGSTYYYVQMKPNTEYAFAIYGSYCDYSVSFEKVSLEEIYNANEFGYSYTVGYPDEYGAYYTQIVYNGKEQTPMTQPFFEVLMDYNNGYNSHYERLIPVFDVDYTLSYENNIGPGQAAVIINGKDNVTGQLFVPFTIKEGSEEGSYEPSESNTPIEAGSVVPIDGNTFKVSATADNTVTFTKAQNTRSVKVPPTISINGETYDVTAVSAKAFTGKKIRSVTIDKNVTKINKNAFKGSSATTITVKSMALTKAGVKGSLKGSKIKTIKVKVGTKKQNKTYVKKYKKIFTKANAGKKVTVK